MRKNLKWLVAIPSFIQGISTTIAGSLYQSAASGRNPFLYSGHFNIPPMMTLSMQGMSGSQSLPLFRAFQQGGRWGDGGE